MNVHVALGLHCFFPINHPPKPTKNWGAQGIFFSRKPSEVQRTGVGNTLMPSMSDFDTYASKFSHSKAKALKENL